YRRMLVDMHIGDWDEGFLARYDPENLAAMYERAGLESVMFYCQSHVGLCYWPTRHGKMHACLKGRDVVKEMLDALRKRGIAACAYYSVVFDNWAFLEHPDWREAPASSKGGGFAGAFEGSRYGLVCPNHPDYRAYAMNQVEDLLGNYSFEGMFFDMTFWPTVCVCASCRRRYHAETQREIPTVIDWCDPRWCEFQAARERWMTEFALELTAKVKAVSPGITVYHNFATAQRNWTLGVSCDATAANDFLGADFYGDPVEQLFACKLFGNLSRNRPIEFMTSRCGNLGDHEQTKSFEQMEMQTLAARLFGGASLWIDAINLDGTVYPGVYDRVREAYDRAAKYEPYLGGEPVEDIAVYFSSESKMDFRENGISLAGAQMWGKSYPHINAVRGACRILQRAHLPFGVITRKQLAHLGRYKMVLLPNVLRMDAEEVRAFREYVRGGGRLYASRYTSLTETRGVRHDDFLLADVFGAHLAADDLGTVTYLRANEDAFEKCIAPQGYLTHFAPAGSPAEGAGMLRLQGGPDGEVLATLTLPYAKEWGDIFGQNWASIHSSPPWKDTGAPVVVCNQFGDGRVIYSAADIECIESPANEGVFRSLIRRLLDAPTTYEADAHPAVWMNALHQPENRRYVVGFLNYQSELPAVPIASVPFTLRPPEGKSFARLVRLPEETPVDFTAGPDGALRAQVENLEVFRMLAAEYH
ncbi:MAG TPA: alpha-amylase family protein, partial [Phycisphaerae bacterium]|nr:alpha-amylase family protein [Phycisphaerae bacterium]